MKITTDVNHAGIRPAGNVSSRVSTTHTGRGNSVSAQLYNDAMAKIQRDKAMMDALIIAQSSRVLVQKAMDISARLRSIASQAMTTGMVNREALSTEMADIQGTMQSHGEIVTIPVSGGGKNSSDDFHNELQELSSTAERLNSGEKINPEVFDAAHKRMEAIKHPLDRQIVHAETSLKIKSGNEIKISRDEQTREIAAAMRNNPLMSLTAQAGINPETVKALTAV